LIGKQLFPQVSPIIVVNNGFLVVNTGKTGYCGSFVVLFSTISTPDAPIFYFNCPKTIIKNINSIIKDTIPHQGHNFHHQEHDFQWILVNEGLKRDNYKAIRGNS
jgi:hypothetical protein